MYEQWTPPPSARQRQAQKQLAKKRTKQSFLTLGLCTLVFLNHNQAPDSFIQQHLPNLQESLTQLGTAFQQPTPLWQEVSSFFQTLATPLSQEVESTEEIGSAVLVFSPDMLKISTLEEYEQEKEILSADSQEISPNSMTPPYDFTHELAYFASPSWTISSKLWSDLIETEDKAPLASEIAPSTPLEIDPSPPEIEATTPESDPSPQYPIGTILQTNATNLPETHTEDYIYLGNRETTTPVLNIITSPYGGRTNPVTGNTDDIHNGVDIRGSEGTDIFAWSEGVVETVGETPFVGRYVRIDHGDNITSFYAHCSTVLVKEGQTIENGEIIAKVGATGQVTGPHLHFELRYGETYLNPLHYIENTGFLDTIPTE